MWKHAKGAPRSVAFQLARYALIHLPRVQALLGGANQEGHSGSIQGHVLTGIFGEVVDLEWASGLGSAHPDVSRKEARITVGSIPAEQLRQRVVWSVLGLAQALAKPCQHILSQERHQETAHRERHRGLRVQVVASASGGREQAHHEGTPDELANARQPIVYRGSQHPRDRHRCGVRRPRAVGVSWLSSSDASPVSPQSQRSSSLRYSLAALRTVSSVVQYPYSFFRVCTTQVMAGRRQAHC